jgi:hypothetical protein
LSERTKSKVHHPLSASLPQKLDAVGIAAAKAECQIRTFAEWVLAHAFVELPYGATAFLAAKQVAAACKLARNMGITLSCETLARAFPKGAIGIQQTKALHDDGNAALIPGIWTSVAGDDNVILRFVGCNFDAYFRTTTKRFSWFYGWIPHKTEMIMRQGQASVTGCSNHCKCSHKPMDTFFRLHHSAFSKPEFEHVALILFSKKHVKNSIQSYRQYWQ